MNFENAKQPHELWELAAAYIQAGINSQINWEDTIFVFGMATQALIATAQKHGEIEAGSRAQARFNAGFSENICIEYKDGKVVIQSTEERH